MAQQNGDRGNRGGRNSGGKLVWKHEITLESGDVRCDITSTPFSGDRLGLSCVLCRQMEDGRQSKFLRPQDLADAISVAGMADSYCEDAQAEFKINHKR